jgi:hypothetical protein
MAIRGIYSRSKQRSTQMGRNERKRIATVSPGALMRWRLLRPYLDRRQRTLWAAAEAVSVGHGGCVLLAEITGISATTISARIQHIKKTKRASLLTRRPDRRQFRAVAGIAEACLVGGSRANAIALAACPIINEPRLAAALAGAKVHVGGDPKRFDIPAQRRPTGNMPDDIKVRVARLRRTGSRSRTQRRRLQLG